MDEFTGRLMVGRRYSEGLHQSIEAKEGVKIQRESQTLATITFQNYFRLYEKLAGMTGTAATEAEEFHKIYKLEVVVIPTHRPMVRKDMPDQIYKTEVGQVPGSRTGDRGVLQGEAPGAGGHGLHRQVGDAERDAGPARYSAPGAEREAAREGGRHHRPGGRPGR